MQDGTCTFLGDWAFSDNCRMLRLRQPKEFRIARLVGRWRDKIYLDELHHILPFWTDMTDRQCLSSVSSSWNS